MPIASSDVVHLNFVSLVRVHAYGPREERIGYLFKKSSVFVWTHILPFVAVDLNHRFEAMCDFIYPSISP